MEVLQDLAEILLLLYHDPIIFGIVWLCTVFAVDAAHPAGKGVTLVVRSA